MKDLIKKFIPDVLLSWYHFVLSFLGAVIYQFPSKKIKVIGVTGTNGKSTVVEMTSRILEGAGFRVASLSSIRLKIGSRVWLNTQRMTMPGRFFIQKFLRQAINSGCQYAVLEVTSEGIRQHRHQFINFEAAVFTNLTPEHIEAHGSFEKYREAKRKLFQTAKKIQVVNLDDDNAKYFLEFPANRKFGYTLNLVSDLGFRVSDFIQATDIQTSNRGVNFTVKNIPFQMKLLGIFNIYNALAAISVGLSQRIDLETSKLALEKIEEIPGRMEKVISQPFKVFVDYAFTPNALEKVYQTIKNNFKPKKMVCVLGSCGGGRDKWKRPVLGKLAAKYCNEVIITNEDPYDEDPMEIIKQVAKGAGNKAKKILDRREAIKTALKITRRGDVLIITGKGCEPSIFLAKDKKIPWDDRRAVKEEFKKLKTKKTLKKKRNLT